MILLAIVVILALVVVVCYNNLIRKKNEIKNAFGSIDAMLKKRFDLIPNLVATVQQYAKHEASVFGDITALRGKSYSDMTSSQKTDFDQQFSEVSRSFFALAENYPDLKASDNFMQLQRSLNETEEQLCASRRTYNACVTDYNNSVQAFPGNIIANMFGFKTEQVFSIPETERQNVNVKELFRS